MLPSYPDPPRKRNGSPESHAHAHANAYAYACACALPLPLPMPMPLPLLLVRSGLVWSARVGSWCVVQAWYDGTGGWWLWV